MLAHRHTLILADDHPMMLESLTRLLEPELEVIANARDGLRLVEAAAELRPDLVITDISMPGLDGIEATRRVLAASPTTRVMVLTFHPEPLWAHQAYAAGAAAYLVKTSAPEEIEAATRTVLRGGTYTSPSFAPAPPYAFPPDGHDGLTPREQEVARSVGRGLGNREIAEALCVSVTTVRTHLKNIYTKLGRSSRVDVAVYAVQQLGVAP